MLQPWQERVLGGFPRCLGRAVRCEEPKRVGHVSTCKSVRRARCSAIPLLSLVDSRLVALKQHPALSLGFWIPNDIGHRCCIVPPRLIGWSGDVGKLKREPLPPYDESLSQRNKLTRLPFHCSFASLVFVARCLGASVGRYRRSLSCCVPP